VQKDVARLRSAVQALTSNVLPVIRVLDFIPEDIDAMCKELEMWRRETQLNADTLETEERSVISSCTYRLSPSLRLIPILF